MNATKCPKCDGDLDKEHDLYSCDQCRMAWPHSFVENGMLTREDHSHLCPWCFRHVPCDMDCSISAPELLDEHGLPTGHPVICDECEKHQPKHLMSIGFDPIAMGC